MSKVLELHLQKLSKGSGGEIGVKNYFRDKCFHVK